MAKPVKLAIAALFALLLISATCDKEVADDKEYKANGAFVRYARNYSHAEYIGSAWNDAQAILERTPCVSALSTKFPGDLSPLRRIGYVVVFFDLGKATQGPCAVSRDIIAAHFKGTSVVAVCNSFFTKSRVERALALIHEYMHVLGLTHGPEASDSYLFHEKLYEACYGYAVDALELFKFERRENNGPARRNDY